ncbi:uncharacterized protein KGF55_004381 [Candida pseudojiufengensis]|uniref:uncharacterized protein n=1 Tax=Candida pseudojiufengensis TaxID=497109 RepID=UPI00222469DE|nr:uncharacterized protein KGF55_004381 [Candida pseudojiufengensis]KAI5960811.1 hypothetical protein KGF55_004381 [Candida pseudojiufengensis]
MSTLPRRPSYNKVNKSIRKPSFSLPTLYDSNHKFPIHEKPEPVKISNELQQLKNKVLNNERISKDEYLQSNHFKFKEGSELKSKELLEKSTNYIKELHPLVAIDCESYEFDHSKITEIGIAILQSTTTTIIPQIITYHIIIEENIHKRSHKYVPDHKDKYMNGTSLIMNEKLAIAFVNKIIQKYLFKLNGIMVGHSINSEFKYFKHLGISLPHNLKIIDTLQLHQIGRSNGGSLWGCLRLLNIPYSYLHNAGNDAYYTLLVALSYCDPQIRILKNLDIYSDSPFFGKKSSKEVTNFVKVDDINTIDI